MKTKILKNTDSEALTTELSVMDEQHTVKFTQYQPVYLPQTGKMLYTAMVFYEEE